MALESDKKKLKNQIKKIKKNTSCVDVEKICKRLKHLRKEFKNLPPERKKAFLKKVGSHHKLDGGKLVLKWHPAIRLLLDSHLVYKGRIAPLVSRSGSDLKGCSEERSFTWWSKWDELRTHLQDFELPDFGLPDTQQ